MNKNNQKIKDWETKKLGDICKVSAGNSAPQKKELFKNGIYPFFRTADVGRVRISNNLIEAKDYLNDVGIEGLRLFKKGTILLPKSGASTFLNHRVILGVDGYVASHLATINTDEKILNNDYLFHLLKQTRAQDLIQDHKYPSLNLSIIKEIEISFPKSLDEQKRIVGILDEAFENIDQAKAIAEQNLKNIEELFNSELQNIFSNNSDEWETKKLGEVTIIARGGSPRPIKEYITQSDDGVNWIKIGDVSESSKYITSTKQKIKKEGVRRSRMVYPGNFLLSNSMSFGRPYILKIEGCIHDGWLVLAVNNEIVDSNFLYNFLSSAIAYKQLDDMAQGSTVRNINIQIAEKLILSYPKSLAEQRKIVERLDELKEKVDEGSAILRSKIAALDELKKSLLQKAFNGEL